MSVLTVLFFLVLLFFAGYNIQRILIGARSLLSALVFSYAFGLSYIIVLCPILDLIWEITLSSVTCAVIPLSFLLFIRKPPSFTSLTSLTLPKKEELILIGLIFLYGVLLRAYTLTDPLSQGQDAWRHLSFILSIHDTSHLPQVVPWALPPLPVTIVMYPPGAHCIGALLSHAVGEVSFRFLESFFILTATGSALSSYVVFKELFDPKHALISSLLIASFMPHMVMSSEITAQSLAIFLFPLIPYFFYKEKYLACILLTSSTFLIHHFSAFSLIMSLFCIAFGFMLKTKKFTYFLAFFSICGSSLLLTSPWWSHVSLLLANTVKPTAHVPVTQTISLDPYTATVSPLFILLSMIGFFSFFRRKEKKYVLMIAWALILFLATQPAFPIKFHEHRFLAFFIFPCSVMAASGLLSVRHHIRPALFIILLLLLCVRVPPQFWPSAGEENLSANGWLEESTLDPVVYVYGPHYTYVYALSQRKLYEITDFDDPFSSQYAPTYFYDDAAWVPHDVSRFGRHDKLYSCSTVSIHRID